MNRRTFIKLTGGLSVSPFLFAKKAQPQGINIEESRKSAIEADNMISLNKESKWNRIATIRPRSGKHVIVYDGYKYMITYIFIKKDTVDLKNNGGVVDTKTSVWYVPVQNLAETEDDGKTFYPTFCPAEYVSIQPEHQWMYLSDLYLLQQPLDINNLESNKIYVVTEKENETTFGESQEISIAIKTNDIVDEDGERILPLRKMGFIDHPVPDKDHFIYHDIEKDVMNAILDHSFYYMPSSNIGDTFKILELPPVITKKLTDKEIKR
jgi:hypothetical protein